jgi:hypothetical protein
MKRTLLIFAMLFAILVSAAHAQTTAFNFQGRLNDGNNPANGRYDLQFLLYDAVVGGNQVGPILLKSNQMLVNGVFSTSLDFGGAAFSGGDRFLEIQLRPTPVASITPNAFVILGARQQLLSVPYAVKSLNSTNATNATNATTATNATNAVTAVNAVNATNATNAQNAVNSQQLGGVPADQYVRIDSPLLPKAMIKVSSTNGGGGNPFIAKCYNSALTGTAATTPPCGYTLNNFTAGGYGIDFGFNTQNFFVSLAVENNSGSVQGEGLPNMGVYFQRINQSQTSLNVRTYNGDDRTTTTNAIGFTIILY